MTLLAEKERKKIKQKGRKYIVKKYISKFFSYFLQSLFGLRPSLFIKVFAFEATFGIQVIAQLRKIFENLLKFWTYECKTGKPGTNLKNFS